MARGRCRLTRGGSNRWVGGARAAVTLAGMLHSRVPIGAGGQSSAPPTGLPGTADGKPDLAGVWQAMNTAAWNIQAHDAQKDVPAGLGVVEGQTLPYQPWAAAKQKENFAHRATADPEGKCKLPGVPRITYMPYPF